MYSLIVLTDEIVILRDTEELFRLRRSDLPHALELFANLHAAA